MGTTRTTDGAEGRRIGELAQASGLTVRTLHHYDEIGLLIPSERSAAGHRLYDAADVERLYRICRLRQLGLALGEIAHALDDPDWDLRAAMAAQLHDLERRLETEARLRARLTNLVALASASEAVPTTDVLDLLEDMTMLDTAVRSRISTLVYADLEASYDYLIRVFGLGPGVLTRDDDGVVHHAELHAGDGVVWLHPESPEFGLASPRAAGVSTALHAVMVDDVDAHFRHVKAAGAVIEYEPVDQPYGYREYSARDLEGGLWSFMKPLD